MCVCVRESILSNHQNHLNNNCLLTCIKDVIFGTKSKQTLLVRGNSSSNNYFLRTACRVETSKENVMCYTVYLEITKKNNLEKFSHEKKRNSFLIRVTPECIFYLHHDYTFYCRTYKKKLYFLLFLMT